MRLRDTGLNRKWFLLLLVFLLAIGFQSCSGNTVTQEEKERIEAALLPELATIGDVLQLLDDHESFTLSYEKVIDVEGQEYSRLEDFAFSSYDELVAYINAHCTQRFISEYAEPLFIANDERAAVLIEHSGDLYKIQKPPEERSGGRTNTFLYLDTLKYAAIGASRSDYRVRFEGTRELINPGDWGPTIQRKEYLEFEIDFVQEGERLKMDDFQITQLNAMTKKSFEHPVA
jgi:hypothetical protein